MMKMSSTSDRWSVTRNEIRDAVAGLIAASPNFRGRGRMTLILDRLLTDPVNPDSYITTGELNDGSRFVFDLRPWGQKFAYYYRNWERDHVRTLRRLYKGGAFLDAGSSLGIFVVGMGNAVSEHGGRILSFEPVPFNLERQRVNISLNGLQDVVDIFPFALGASGGLLRLTTDLGSMKTCSSCPPSGATAWAVESRTGISITCLSYPARIAGLFVVASSTVPMTWLR